MVGPAGGIGLPHPAAGHPALASRRLICLDQRDDSRPDVLRQMRPYGYDQGEIRSDFLRKKQAGSKLWGTGDRIRPWLARKCFCYKHFLNEAEGSPTLNLWIDSLPPGFLKIRVPRVELPVKCLSGKELQRIRR